ncbi:MAG TPA: hypothetical protein DIU11_17230 [Pusillimonas sp.]|nr:hypothetical protein [Pusillimonas sp.]
MSKVSIFFFLWVVGYGKLRFVSAFPDSAPDGATNRLKHINIGAWGSVFNGPDGGFRGSIKALYDPWLSFWDAKQ